MKSGDEDEDAEEGDDEAADEVDAEPESEPAQPSGSVLDDMPLGTPIARGWYHVGTVPVSRTWMMPSRAVSAMSWNVRSFLLGV